MSASTFFLRMATVEEAVRFVEEVRWGEKPNCPYCQSFQVSRHQSADRSRPRWQCIECSRAFSATVNTPMHNSRVDLRSWLAVAAYTVRPPTRQISVRSMAHRVHLSRPATVHGIQQRVRGVLEKDDEQSELLLKLIGLAEDRYDQHSVLRR